MPGESLQRDIAEVLNFYSEDSRAETPDFILAKYLLACLDAFKVAQREAAVWRGEHAEKDTAATTVRD